MHVSHSAASRMGLAGLLAVVTMMATAVALVLAAPPVAAQHDDAVEVTDAEIRDAQGDVLTTIGPRHR